MSEQQKPMPSTEEIKPRLLISGIDVAEIIVNSFPVGVGIVMIVEGGILTKIGGVLLLGIGIVGLVFVFQKMRTIKSLALRLLEAERKFNALDAKYKERGQGKEVSS